jgi:hypothetical protein
MVTVVARGVSDTACRCLSPSRERAREQSFDAWVAEIDELAELSVVDLEQRLRESEMRRRREEAIQALIVAKLEDKKWYRRDGHASMFGLLRAVPHWSEAECRSRTKLARLLAARADVAEALWDGELSVANADAIARLFANPRLADRFDSVIGNLLREAQRMEHDDFRRLPARWELLNDPGTRAERAEIDQRRDAHMSIVDGKGILVACFGDLDAARNREILERFVQAEFERDWDATVERYGDAAKTSLMPRNDAQRRADALSAIFTAASSTAPGWRAPKHVAVIHVDWDSAQEMLTIAGLFPERVAVDPFDDPTPLISQLRCETGDGELINPDEVLKVLLEGYVRFVIHNDKAIPIRWGRTRRLFRGAARDAVMSLGWRCQLPGCRVRSGRCHADHLHSYATGGATDPDNGGPCCPRQNRQKQRQGWQIERDRYGHFHTYRADGTEIR